MAIIILVKNWVNYITHWYKFFCNFLFNSRSLAENLASKGIRVNAVAPGSVCTPFILSTSIENDISGVGSKTSMKRPGQPIEIAEAYVYLACDEA